MTTNEVEVLAKVFRKTVADATMAEGLEPAIRAGVEAVARAVRAQDEARGGTLTATALIYQLERIPLEVRNIIGTHLAAQGRTIAAQEAAYAGLQRDINADIDGKLALRKALGARDDETYPEFVTRLAREKSAAASALATLRQTVEPFMHDIRRDVEDSLALDGNRQMTVGRLHTVGEARALVAAYDATPSEHPDTATSWEKNARIYAARRCCPGHEAHPLSILPCSDAYANTLRAIRERANDRKGLVDAHLSETGSGSKIRAVVEFLLGDSGPSGEKVAHGFTELEPVPLNLSDEPTTPPDVATSEAPMTNAEARRICESAGVNVEKGIADAMALVERCGLAPTPTPEEDWRTVEKALDEGVARAESDAMAERFATARRAIARLRDEPRRAADKALRNLALRLGDHATGYDTTLSGEELEVAIFRFVRDEEERARKGAAEAMRERCALTAPSIADAIMRNLSDRSGVLDGIDEDVLEEMRDTLTEIVRARISALPL